MIGIFDSGVGGLTVLRALREELPSADVVYFGDTKNAPYGEKSREELSALTVAGVRLLQ
ncbi:MAG: glutamate racemase, partial [Patescibacteria group bacterium]|nr:glutamate racemase [Patescibacteria group bacterium]